MTTAILKLPSAAVQQSGLLSRLMSSLPQALQLPSAQPNTRMVASAPPLHDDRLPQIVLCGRPNVGKSTMFNRLVGRRDALVYDTPAGHVTRDYKEGIAQLSDLRFRVVDTSGLEAAAQQGSIHQRAAMLTKQVLEHTAAALLLIDARIGVTAADADAAQWLRTHCPPHCALHTVAAKCDHYDSAQLVASTQEAVALGLGEAVPYSAETGAGTVELYELLQPLVDTHMHRASHKPGSENPDEAADAAEQGKKQAAPFGGWQPRAEHSDDSINETIAASDERADTDAASKQNAPDALAHQPVSHAQLGVDAPIKLAIVGLPNAGKSTLLNRLLGYNRAVTGPEPGLTRDAVSAPFVWRGTQFELIDTAGWMRRATLSEYDESGGRVAGLTVVQGKARIDFAHAVLLLIDAPVALHRAGGAIATVSSGGAATLAPGAHVLDRREVHLARTVLEEGRLLTICANKLDALSKSERTALLAALQAQVDTGLASWRDCVTVQPLSGAEGLGVDDALRRVTELVPKWDSFIPRWQLNSWRYKVSSADASNTTLKALKFVKMVATRPPTLLAEFRPAAPNASFLTATARALRSAFSLHGVPIRVLSISKERVSDAKRATSAKLTQARSETRGPARATTGGARGGQRSRKPLAVKIADKKRREQAKQTAAHFQNAARRSGSRQMRA